MHRKSNSIFQFLPVLLIAYSLHGQEPMFISGSPAGRGWGRGFAIDSAGNSYVAGYFDAATASVAQRQLNNAGGSDIYVAKFDAAGNCLWASQAGGPGTDYVNHIAVDAAGNCYVTGFFNVSVQFGTFTLTAIPGSPYGMGRFLVKYDTRGACQWAMRLPAGSGDVTVQGMAADGTGCLYLTGSFQKTVPFGNGITLTCPGLPESASAFIAKYSPEGLCLWATQSGSSGDAGSRVAVDAQSNVYVIGDFSRDTKFGNFQLHSDVWVEVFVVKFDNAGKPIWAKQAKGKVREHGYGIAIDPSGNCTITGDFESDSLKFDQFLVRASGPNNAFIARYDTNGDCLWATANGGRGTVRGRGVVSDAQGNSYVVGEFDKLTTFGNRTIVNKDSSTDLFICKYDRLGNCLWAKSAGGNGNDFPKGLALDRTGSLRFLGDYTSNDGVQGDCYLDQLHMTGDRMIIAKLTDGVLGVEEEGKSLSGISVAFTLAQNYPNPFNPSTTISFTLQSGSFVTLKIFDVMGREVTALVSQEKEAGTYQMRWNASGMPSGVYFYRLQAGIYTETKRLVILK